MCLVPPEFPTTAGRIRSPLAHTRGPRAGAVGSGAGARSRGVLVDPVDGALDPSERIKVQAHGTVLLAELCRNGVDQLVGARCADELREGNAVFAHHGRGGTHAATGRK